MTTESKPVGGAPTADLAPFNAAAGAASLTVKDIRKSLAWYRDVVGFTVDREHERDGQLRAVSFRAGAVKLLITQDDGAKGLDRVKGEGFSLQYTVAGSVDDVANRIKQCGGTLDSEPTDMPWGVRVFRLRDPDGFKMVISS
jgi:uncharacterized glyoxalase superfamily protein PhnB